MLNVSLSAQLTQRMSERDWFHFGKPAEDVSIPEIVCFQFLGKELEKAARLGEKASFRVTRDQAVALETAKHLRDLAYAQSGFGRELLKAIRLIRVDEKHAENSPRSSGKDVLDPLWIFESGGGTDDIDVYVVMNEGQGSIEVDVANAQFLASSLHRFGNIRSRDHRVEVLIRP